MRLILAPQLDPGSVYSTGNLAFCWECVTFNSAPYRQNVIRLLHGLLDV
jgi:hypothetical protein